MSVSDYTPTVQDIAAMLRARTRTSYGDLMNDFTDETEPTGEDVQGLIEIAVDDVSGAIGTNIPVEFQATAKVLVTYLAAANVELSYWPTQAAATNSMYDKLMARYNTRLTQLMEDMGDIVTDGAVVDSGVSDSDWNIVGGGYPQPYWWSYAKW